MAILKKLIDPKVFMGTSNPWSGGPTTNYDDSDPLTPPSIPTNSRSSVALSPAFSPNAAQPNPMHDFSDPVKDYYMPGLQDIGSRLREAYNPPPMGVGGTLRHVLGALMSQRNPQLGSLISGDYGRQQKIAGLTKQYGLTEDAIAQDRAQKTAELSQQNIGSEIKERGRANDIRQQVADTKENPPPKNIGEQDVDYLQTQINPDTKKPYTLHEAYAKSLQTAQDVKPDNEKGGMLTDLDIGGENHKVLVHSKTGEIIKDLGKSKLPVPAAAPGEHAFETENAKQVTKDLTTARGADFRLRSMTGSYKDATEKNDQQAMLNLLTNHIGMTLGLQKGARITKDILHEATASAPWLQSVAAKFDSDGYLSGVVLTKGQMDSMMKLAHAQRHTAWQQAHDSASQAGLTDKVQFPKDFVPEGNEAPSTGGLKITRDANGRITGVE